MATNATIPSIPLSPITKAWLLCQDNLEQADEALKTAKKQTHPEVSLNVLRRLIEDVKIQRDRYENLGRQMQSLQTETCFHWSPDTLAKQIAIVDCQLFGLVKLDNTSLLCQLDMKQTHLDKLMDFHSYLTNSFAHQLIFWSDQIYSPQHHQQQPKESMISHLVQVAYALFHTYRDLSGFAAIMKALMLPEVRRLRSIWKRCSSRIKEMYTEMVAIMSPDHHYQAYHQALYKKLASFFFNNNDQPHHHSITTSTNESSSSKMVIIPWIQPHLLSIHSIVTDYAAVGGGHATSQVPAATGLCHQQQDMELVLSAPGLQKLAIVVALLEQCQTCTTTSSSSSTIDLLEDILKPFRQDINNSSTSFSASKNDYDQINNNNNNNNNNKKKNRRQSVLSMPPKLSFDINHSAATTSSFHSQQTIHYLNQLYPGDLSVHHWLVSRVYLRKDQLVEESLQVQPLLHGEQLVCDAYSPDDEALMMITNTKHLELLQHHLSQSNKKKLQDQVEEEEERKEEPSPRISATFAGWKSTSLDEPFSSSISQELRNHSDQQIDNKKEQKEDDDDNDDDDDDHKSDGDMGNNNDAKIVKSQELDDINIFQNNNKPPAITAANDILSTRKEQDTATLDDLVKLSTSITTLNQTTTDQKVDVKDKEKEIKDKKEMIKSEQQQIENKENNISKNNVIKNTNNNNTIITKTTTSNIDQSFTNTNDSSKNIDNNTNHINNNNNNNHNNNNNNNNISEKEEKEKKSKLSPTAPEFVPSYHYTSSIQSNNKKSATDNNNNNNNNNNNDDDDDSSEEWNGYPTPTLEQQQQNPSNHSDEDEEEDDEVWTGYPGSKRPASIQSIISEEWKGYQAAKMEATWEMETALKVQLHEWQGYALETLNEEDLDGQ